MGKKVGIITFVNAGNYGAELQAFASQYILNKMGYDAIFFCNKRNKQLIHNLDGPQKHHTKERSLTQNTTYCTVPFM